MIVAGAPEDDPTAYRELLAGATVIAADGGWRLCQRAGVTPGLLVGDMDTLSAEEVQQAVAEGSELRRFPPNKDQSDLELALLAAQELKARRLTILGALGGQWDHCLANLLAPLSLCWRLGIWGRLLAETAEIYLLQPGSYRFHGRPGQRVSLAALSSEVTGVTLEGMDYPLENGSFRREQTVGLANGLSRPSARLQLGTGELLVTLLR